MVFRSFNILLLFTVIPYVFHNTLPFLFYLVATKTQNSSAGVAIKHFYAEKNQANLVKFNHRVGLILLKLQKHFRFAI